MGCSVSHSRRKEKGRAYLEDVLVAGKGLGEDRTNGAAARPVVAARKGRAGGESPRDERRERFKKQRASERDGALQSERERLRYRGVAGEGSS